MSIVDDLLQRIQGLPEADKQKLYAIKEAKIAKEHYPSVSAVTEKDREELLSLGRIRTVVDAIRRLSTEHPDIPVIGTLTGPISLAASLVDPMNFYRELRKDRENANHRAEKYGSDAKA